MLNKLNSMIYFLCVLFCLPSIASYAVVGKHIIKQQSTLDLSKVDQVIKLKIMRVFQDDELEVSYVVKFNHSGCSAFNVYMSLQDEEEFEIVSKSLGVCMGAVFSTSPYNMS